MRGFIVAAALAWPGPGYSFGEPLLLSPPCPPVTVDRETGTAIFCPPTHDTHGNVLGTRRTADDGTVYDNTLRHCTIAETHEGGFGAVYQFDEAALAGHRTLVVRLCSHTGQATVSAECANDFGVSDIARVSYSCGSLGPPQAPGITAPAEVAP